MLGRKMSGWNTGGFAFKVFMALAATGCGTIVGNPKQPAGAGQTPKAVVYVLPRIDLELPSEATAEDTAGLNLAEDVGSADRGLLFSWSRRFQRMVREVDSWSDRITKIAAQEREGGNQDAVLKFKGRGKGGKLAGKLQPIQDDGFAFQATLCLDEQVASQVSWSEDGQKIRLKRNFAARDGDADDSFGLVSEITVTKGQVLTLDLTTQGEFDDSRELPANDGNQLAESAHVERLADGEILIRSVADRSAAAQTVAGFTPDSYLVGRLVPTGGSAPSAYQTEYAGYFQGFKVLCRSGFDESAEDLWAPTWQGPRFCVGRPLGGKSFADRAAFSATLARLRPIGVQLKSELRAVQIAQDSTCD